MYIEHTTECGRAKYVTLDMTIWENQQKKLVEAYSKSYPNKITSDDEIKDRMNLYMKFASFYRAALYDINDYVNQQKFLTKEGSALAREINHKTYVALNQFDSSKSEN